MTTPRLELRDVAKSFTMHLRDGVCLRVLGDVSFTVLPGECVVLGGPSGAGKSSILKIVYGNYAADSGAILLDREDGAIDIAAATPRQVLAARRAAVGYVSQFLRVVPRVPAREIVAEPLVARGVARDEALPRAEALLERLNLPRPALGPAARHLLRWRAAAHQCRARLYRALPAPPPR